MVSPSESILNSSPSGSRFAMLAGLVFLAGAMGASGRNGSWRKARVRFRFLAKTARADITLCSLRQVCSRLFALRVGSSVASMVGPRCLN
jgi:hypothetical protein